MFAFKSPTLSVEHPPKPRLTYRVGVVGHRPRAGEAFDVSSVRAQIERILGDIGVLLSGAMGPSYDPTFAPSLTLISALAEGADQIAADALRAVALPTGVDRRLEAVTPFAVDEYAATFTDPRAADALQTHIGLADAVLELADWTPPQNTSPLSDHRRDRRYGTVGELVLRQADVLIAIWDGQPARGRGGTTETVTLAIGQGTPIIWITPQTGSARVLRNLPRYGDVFELVEDEDGNPAVTREELAKMVDEIVRPPADTPGNIADTQRAKSPESLAYFLEQEEIYETCNWRTYERWLAAPAKHRVLLDEWKHGPDKESVPRPKRPRSLKPLQVAYFREMLRRQTWSGFPVDIDKGHLRHLRDVLGTPWAAADAVATRLGHIYRSTYLRIFSLGAMAVAAGLIGLFLVTGLAWSAAEPVFSLLELLLLAAAILFYTLSRGHAHHARWMQARAITEQIRAHWALTLLGVGGRRTLGSSMQWSAWLFNAYAANAGLHSQHLNAEALSSIARAIQLAIVRDQIDYHSGNHMRLSAIHRRLESWGQVALLVAAACSMLLLSLTVLEALLDWASPHLIETYTTPMVATGMLRLLAVLAAILPAIGAAIAGVRYQGDFERFSERSGETSKALARIDTGLSAFIEEADAAVVASAKVPLYETLRDIATDLERVLLSDLEDWRFVYRARPIFGPE